MRSTNWIVLRIAITLAIILTACGGITKPDTIQTQQTATPTVKPEASIVVEGRLVPHKTVALAFGTSGKVIEVLVEEGDKVQTGTVLARLGNQEELEANIARAELELLNAQQSLQRLEEEADIKRVEALKRIANLSKAVKDAQYQLDNFTIPSNQIGLEPMAAVKLMEQKLDEARKAFEPYKSKSENDPTRKLLKEKLDQAQSDYNSAIRRLQLVLDLETAKAELERANNDYEAVKEGADIDDINAAKARIRAAETALAATKAALDRLELVATIDGTIVDIDLIVGKQVNALQPVVTIADFSKWYVETDNLTELEVIDISLGQEVTMTPDALPDVQLTGVVNWISEFFEEKRGDVTYTVRILVNEVDSRLRWGMTLVVNFK